MVEYGQGVGQVSGQTGGGGGAVGAGGSVDVGVSFGNWVADSIHTISTMPPALLVTCLVGLFVGLVILKRAF